MLKIIAASEMQSYGDWLVWSIVAVTCSPKPSARSLPGICEVTLYVGLDHPRSDDGFAVAAKGFTARIELLNQSRSVLLLAPVPPMAVNRADGVEADCRKPRMVWVSAVPGALIAMPS